MHKFLILFFICPFFLLAQPKTTLLPGFDDSQEDEHSMALDAKTGNIYLLFCEWQYVSGVVEGYEYKWDVEILSSDLKQKRTAKPKILEMPNGKRATAGKLLSFNGNTYAVFMVYNKKQDKTIVYRSRLSAEKGFGAFEEIGELSGKFRDHLHQLNFAFSADSSRFLIAQFPITNEPNMGGYSFLVLDQACQVVNKGVLGMPVNTSPRLVGAPIVTNDGAIWAPVWTDKDAFQQEIWVWRVGSQQPKRIDAVPMAEHIATDIKLVQSPYDGFVYAGGVFASATGNGGKSIFGIGGMFSKDRDPEQGTFTLKLDSESGQILSKTVAEFTEKTVQFWGKKTEILEKEDGINWLVVAGVLPLPDGSVWLAAEQAFAINKQIKGVYNSIHFGARAQVLERDQYTHESVIVALYDAQGKWKQESVLGRSAWSTSLNSINCLLTTGHANELLLLYVDHDENIGKPGLVEKNLKTCNANAMNANKRDACTAMAIFSTNGKTDIKCVESDNGSSFSYTNFIKISPKKSLVFYPSKGGEYGIMSIEWP